MENIDLDWYTYLSEDFKRDRTTYKTKEKAVFDCPKCGGNAIVRVGHVKAKIKALGYYECSRCRKSAHLERLRGKI